MTNNLFFIGLNGFAGAGKDTVAKMLKTILGHKWNSIDECKEYYNSIYTNPTWTATFHSINLDNDNNEVLCIAYADQLKMICSTIFGIPFERFYMNKSNAWVCLNDKFQYTEVKPASSYIITADEYYYGYDDYNSSKDKYWMSLREILVYIGTYVLQNTVNKNIFINIVRNKINEFQQKNPNLKYVIVTDNRFIQEMEYIHENNGVTITIIRDSIEQLNNVAEHDLDDIEGFDFTIDNSNGYDELFQEVWDLVNNNLCFKNITTNLITREDINNYLRVVNKISDTDYVWEICTSYPAQKIYKDDELIKIIDLTGGPIITINEELETSDYILFVKKITYNEETNKFYIITNIK